MYTALSEENHHSPTKWFWKLLHFLTTPRFKELRWIEKSLANIKYQVLWNWYTHVCARVVVLYLFFISYYFSYYYYFYSFYYHKKIGKQIWNLLEESNALKSMSVYIYYIYPQTSNKIQQRFSTSTAQKCIIKCK